MKKTVGMGFLLFAKIDGMFRMFTVEEPKDKVEIFKKAGMVGPPFETVEENDNRDGYPSTVHRIIMEEIGYPRETIEICECVSQKFRLIPGRRDIFTCYGYGIYTGDPNSTPTPSDASMKFAGWRTIEEICEFPLIRVETLPILTHFSETGRYEKMLRILRCIG